MIAVSVIVPVYNASKYLPKCIESLVCQSLENLEIILVDDGSTDCSYEIMSKYRQQHPDRIRIFQKENGGQGTARNLGISVAKGEYIGFVDADDYVALEMFEEMYEKAVKEKLDMVQCYFTYLKENGEVLPSYGNVREYRSRKDMFIDSLVSPWNKLIRLELLKDNEVTFTEGYIYEDTAFFLKLIPYIRSCKLIEKSFVFHIDRGDSTMNANKSRKVAHIFPVLKDALNYYEEKGLRQQYKEELEYFCVKVLLCSSMQRIARVEDKGLRKELLGKTVEMLDKKFPEHRKNKYFRHRYIGLYTRIFCKWTAGLILAVFRVKESIR